MDNSRFHAPLRPPLDEQEELLLLLMQEEGLLAARQQIQPVSREERLPVSFAQQRLWFLEQWQPGNPAYHIPLALDLHGPLSVEVLQASLSQIVARHESVRTTFTIKDGQPLQVIGPVVPFVLPFQDLSEVPTEQHDQLVRELSQQENLRPFDFAHGPLLRGLLLRLGPERHRLLLNMHHIIADGWSLTVLVQELVTLYSALRQKRPSSLPPLPIQYVDFACWQRHWLAGEALQPHRDYWRQQLAGMLPLELPLDHARPAQQTFAGAHRFLPLPLALTQALKALSRREQVSLFTLLLAATQVLLMRYSGQQDLAVGTPIANRTRSETADLIGYFVNTLVLRTDLSGNPTVGELLQRVRQVLQEAQAHQDLPFEHVVELLQPERDPSRSPLFQVMVTHQTLPATLQMDEALTLTLRYPESPTAKFDLTLLLVEEERSGTPNGVPATFGGQDEASVQVIFEYNTDLFEAATIERMMAHYLNLLAEICRDPAQRIENLAFLSRGERNQLIREWNTTSAPMRPANDAAASTSGQAGGKESEDILPALCFHSCFEAQAACTPDAIALSFQEKHVTYQALDCQTNQLAQFLCRKGVGPETCVGLYMERSLEQILALLAILKAGAAYMPLDPQYPPERLAFMIADARPLLLLTQSSLWDRLPIEGIPHPVLCLDREWSTVISQPTTPPITGVQPLNAAYIIYTSGSSGTPKGVVVPHRGIPNVARNQQQTLAVGPGSRVLQFASLSFDAAVAEIVMALLSGATLVLASREQLLPGPDLLHLVTEQNITTMTLPPSALTTISTYVLQGNTEGRGGGPAFADLIAVQTNQPTMSLGAKRRTVAPTEDEMPTVKTLLVAGEACPDTLVARWSSGRLFFNLYGPTETTIWATSAVCTAERTPPPIGRPIVNSPVYVLDSRLELVPIGVVGELYIGGVGVTRGYLNRPELTAERFMPDPFGSTPGARLYRTGDLGRWCADGQLEFLGRRDRQVKLRGFRIELGEIEMTLARHPAVQQCAVLLREDAPDDKRLVAYLVSQEQTVPTERDLRAFLKETLPDYMIPAAFVTLEQLPLTPNGKLDHRSLLSISPTLTPQSEQEDEIDAPRTPLEHVLAETWKTILGIESITMSDNFFDLGGHSSLATQLTFRVSKDFRMTLSPQFLFEYATLAEFAEALSARESVAGSVTEMAEMLQRTRSAP